MSHLEVNGRFHTSLAEAALQGGLGFPIHTHPQLFPSLLPDRGLCRAFTTPLYLKRYNRWRLCVHAAEGFEENRHGFCRIHTSGRVCRVKFIKDK